MLLKKFLLTGMAVLLSVSFILTGCPTDSDSSDPPASDSTANADRYVATNVAAGDNKLVVRASEGSLAAESDLKVYVKDAGFNEVVIGKARPTDYTEALTGYQVGRDGLVITVTDLAPATVNGAAGVLKAEDNVKVTLAADAQEKQVPSITAVSSKVDPQDASVEVAVGDDTLDVTVNGGSLESGLKVYVKATDFDEVVITKAAAKQGYTVVGSARVEPVAGGATVTGLQRATANGATGVLNAGTVTVILAADAQATPVTSIAATSRYSGNVPVAPGDLQGAEIGPYSAEPTGAVVDPESLEIKVKTVITDVTVAAAAYTDVNSSTSFDGGDTQVFTITLTAASGHSFANTGIAPADVVAAALDGTVFTADVIGNSAAIAASSVTELVVTVTYTKPKVITAADLATGITKHNDRPVGVELSKPLTITANPAIKSGTVAAEAGTFKDPAKGWSVGDSQVFTITLEPETGYTFVGGPAPAVIAAAVLGEVFFLDKTLASNSTGTPADPYKVTVKYTRPNDTTITNALLTAAAIDPYNGKPDGEEVSATLGITGNSEAIASVAVAAALGNQDPAAGWAVGNKQEFTITLTAKEWYRFKGTGSLSGKQVADAVLGPVFVGKFAVKGNPKITDLSYVVTVTYTEVATTDQGISAGVDYKDILAVSNGNPSVSYANVGTVTATISGGTGYANFKWYIDGKALPSGNVTGPNNNTTYTLNTGVLSAKNHSLTVTATKGGITYSQLVTFEVSGL